MKYILFLLTFMLVSCAEKPETTLKVSVGAIGANTNFHGGLVLLGKSNNGFRVSKVVPLGDSAEIYLPNGTWDFSVIGWDNNISNIMEGDSYCAFQQGVSLNGADVILNLNATAANCINPIFGGNIENTDQFQKVEFNSCTGIKYYFEHEGLGIIPPGMTCDGGNTPLPGEFKSFKVIIPEFIAGNNQIFTAGGLNSACQSNDTTSFGSNLRLPKGTRQVPMPYIIKAYSNTTCDDGTGYNKDYIFENGLSGLIPNFEAGAKYDSSINATKVFLNSTPCNPDMLAAQGGADFPIMTVSAGRDSYLICSADDLDNVAAGGNDPNGYYQLGRTINMDDHSGTFGSIANFDGEFRGNGHAIMNGDVPLFGTIANTTTDIVISNLDLINFTITATTANSGILAENLAGASTNQIEIDKIKVINGQITASSGSLRIGGLIGQVQVSASANDNYYIRKCDIDVDIIATTGGQANQVIGGIVGEATGDAGYSLALELNTLGVNNKSNPFDRTKAASISYYATDVTSSAIGGLVGKADMVEIRDFNIAIVDFDTVQNTGGLVGQAVDQLKIENSFANMTYDTINSCANGNPTVEPFTDDRCNSIGGAIGLVDANGDVSIHGVNTKLVIVNNTNQIDVIGGLVGYYKDSGSNFWLNVKDSKADVDVTTDGNYHGGFFGYIHASNVGGDNTVKRSVAVGDLVNASSGDKSIKGGFAGRSNNASFAMCISEVNITGAKRLGGGIGVADGASPQIYESAIWGTISTTVSTGQAYVAGGIGEILTAGSDTEPNIFWSKIDVDLIVNINLSSAYSNYIGLAFGSIPDIIPDDGATTNGEAVSESVIVGSLTHVDGTIYNVADYMCGKYNGSDQALNPTCTDSQFKTPSVSDDSSCGSLTTAPFDIYSSVCQPLFAIKWQTSGIENGEFLAGSKFEPFPISTPGDWNAIKTDEFLMNKTFELTQDIDFNYGTFNPIAYEYDIAHVTNTFKGQLLSNGYKIMNIEYSPSPSPTGGHGLIYDIANDGRIGDRDHPFKIENVNLPCVSDNCGIVANAQTARLYIDAKNINYTADVTGLNCIGGLIGRAYAPSAGVTIEIKDSRFFGHLYGYHATTSAADIGGFIGCAGTTGANAVTIGIKNSGTNIKSLRGLTKLGGIVGNLKSDATINVETAYAKLITDNTYSPQAAPASGTMFGQATGLNDGNITLNSFIADFANNGVANYSALRVLFGPESVGSGSASFTSSGYITYPYGTISDGMVTAASVPDESTHAALYSTLSLDSNEDMILHDNKIKLRWEVEGFQD